MIYDTLRAELADLLKLIRQSELGPPDRLKCLCQKAIADARELDDRESLVRSLTMLAYAEQVTGEIQSAFDSTTNALVLADSNQQLRTHALLRFASLASDVGADTMALLALEAAEKSALEINDRRTLMRTYVSKSTTYLRQEQPDLALQELGRAMHLAHELDDEKMMYWCIHSTGIAHAKRGEYELAIPRYQTARTFYSESKQSYNIAAIDMLLGEAYLHVDIPRARYFLEAALKNAEEHSFELLATQSSIHLAEYHEATDNADDAARCLKRAADMLKTRDLDTKSARLIRRALSKHYEQLGKYKEALEYLK